MTTMTCEMLSAKNERLCSKDTNELEDLRVMANRYQATLRKTMITEGKKINWKGDLVKKRQKSSSSLRKPASTRSSSTVRILHPRPRLHVIVPVKADPPIRTHVVIRAETQAQLRDVLQHHRHHHQEVVAVVTRTREESRRTILSSYEQSKRETTSTDSRKRVRRVPTRTQTVVSVIVRRAPPTRTQTVVSVIVRVQARMIVSVDARVVLPRLRVPHYVIYEEEGIIVTESTKQFRQKTPEVNHQNRVTVKEARSSLQGNAVVLVVEIVYKAAAFAVGADLRRR